MSEENKNPVVKVGDKLVFDYGMNGGLRFGEVKSVSKTGIITLNSGITLRPDLRIRGKRELWSRSPYYASIVTPEIMEKYTRQQNLKYLQGYKWATVENEKIMKIVELLIS